MKPTENDIGIAKKIVSEIMERNFSYAVSFHKTNSKFYDFYRPGAHSWMTENESYLVDEGIDMGWGATKVCLVSEELTNWVIKVGLLFSTDPDAATKIDKDFCALEAKYYQEAVAAGLGHFFSATYELCEVDGIKFYLQERADANEVKISDLFYYYEQSEYGFEEGEDRLDDAVADMEDEERLEAVFGEEKEIVKLKAFIHEWNINDLHEGNFGITPNGFYKIIDFSGYISY